MTEYQSLAVMTILYTFAWLPASLGKWKSFGGKWLASNRDPIPGKDLLPWAARCDRAYNNLKDYFPAFIVAVVLLGLMNKFDSSTRLACIIYILGRTGHFASYGLGNVPGRALFFFTALFSNLYLLLKVLI